MADINNDILSIPVELVTPKYIRHDLKDCLKSCPNKIEKRRNRLRATYALDGVDPEPKIRALPILEEENVAITDQQVMDYLSQPQEINYSPVKYEQDKQKDESVKKAIEADLTSKLNANGYLYKVTCRNITHILWMRICKDKRFKALCESRRIIMVHKGGVAMRYSLLQRYPDQRDTINEQFKFGGDNDVCLMIDPTLEEYDEVHEQLCSFVHKFLNDEAPGFGEGCVATLAKKVRYLKVGNIHMKVKPATRQSFTIRTDAYGNKIQVNSAARYPVYTSYNELSFVDAIGRPSGFTLVRLRQAFDVIPAISENEDIDIPEGHQGRTCSSEVLDIAIPTRRDTKHVEGFQYFANGLWSSVVEI